MKRFLMAGAALSLAATAAAPAVAQSFIDRMVTQTQAQAQAQANAKAQAEAQAVAQAAQTAGPRAGRGDQGAATPAQRGAPPAGRGPAVAPPAGRGGGRGPEQVTPAPQPQAQPQPQVQRGGGAGRGPDAGFPGAGRGPAQQQGRGPAIQPPAPPQAQGRGPGQLPPAQQRAAEARNQQVLDQIFGRAPQARGPTQPPPPRAGQPAGGRLGAAPPQRNWDYRFGQPRWLGGYQVRDRDVGRQWFSANLFRPNYFAPRRFNRVWFPPTGFYVANWYAGDYLPRGWYDPTDYLDWVMYGLPFPPIGTEWVRVGGDAVLVDVWNGEVLSVYRDLFWW